MQSAAPVTHENLKGTARLEAFSDGVFAIAITLLALNLQIPHVEPNSPKWSLATALIRQWPSYVGFVTSFFTILIMWMNHHAIFKFVRKVNAHILFANGILLLITTAIPFLTGMLSEYFSLPEARTACAVYTGSFVFVSISFNYLWWTVIRDRSLLKEELSERAIEKITRNYSMGIPLYLAAFAGTFVSIYVGIGICTFLWIFWSVTVKDL